MTTRRSVIGILAALAAVPGMALAGRPALTITLLATDEFLGQINMLVGLLESGNVPEDILERLRGIAQRPVLDCELETFTPTPARGANGEFLLGIRFRPGGEYDSICTALRAMKLEGQR